MTLVSWVVKYTCMLWFTCNWQCEAESWRTAVERWFESLCSREGFKNTWHHVDLWRFIVHFITVAVMVTQTLHLVPDYRVVKQVEVISDELTDQQRCVSLQLLQLLCTRCYLDHWTSQQNTASITADWLLTFYLLLLFVRRHRVPIVICHSKKWLIDSLRIFSRQNSHWML